MDTLKKAMLVALKKHLGRVSYACDQVNIARSTHYMWLKDDPEYAQAVEDVKERAIDFVESKLMERVNGVTVTKGTNEDGEPIVYEVPPSDTAIIFYLKTIGKKRGYVERQEITGAEGAAPIQIVISDQV
jgi:hypothetical protein